MGGESHSDSKNLGCRRNGVCSQFSCMKLGKLHILRLEKKPLRSTWVLEWFQVALDRRCCTTVSVVHTDFQRPIARHNHIPFLPLFGFLIFWICLPFVGMSNLLLDVHTAPDAVNSFQAWTGLQRLVVCMFKTFFYFAFHFSHSYYSGGATFW